ncbi:Cyanovirin-N [Psilocybe cubensis]|uniref:Cyanovirin-N n=2 Tax=Psilocybe cubensis TaxID=181762 RepID=A0ACB8GWF3_PSICU|nr:Cyanovirin-N [Psilocybe cubensis]KAH9479961.1 Cyanovirin-N [Psilocybe cubensis]
MNFFETCEKITITKGVLTAGCKKADKKTTVHSSISLNDYIGVTDGKLTWGGRGFSHHAEDISVHNGVLSAKVRFGGKVVESKLDLNLYIHNQDGALAIIPVSELSGKHLAAPTLSRGISMASVSSVASATSANSMFSAASATSTSTSVSTTSVTETKSSSSYNAFSSTKFRSESQLLLIEETCTKLELKGTFLHAECRRIDGSVVHSSIDLNTIIGFFEGHLQWDIEGFSTHCFDYTLDGFFLVVKYKVHGDQHRVARIDLRTRIRNSNGVLIVVELNKKLSVMLSEVPWMKFKVIAEPDLSVFANHPVMRQTLVSIAESTVEHVTVEMHKMLTVAMETAITAITASAMKHVSAQMETLVADVAGHASASASITAAESLHLYGLGQYYSSAIGNAYAYGGGLNGRAHYESHGSLHAGGGLNGSAALYEASGNILVEGREAHGSLRAAGHAESRESFHSEGRIVEISNGNSHAETAKHAKITLSV